MTIPSTTPAEQASACLEEAVTWRPERLCYARKLTAGDDEAACDQVQEATLRLDGRAQKKDRPHSTGARCIREIREHLQEFLRPMLAAYPRNETAQPNRRTGQA